MMKPDYANWMRKKLWTIFQGACLAAGEKPTDGKNPPDALSKIADAEKRKVAREIYDHAKDAIDLRELKQAARSRTGRFMDKLVIPAEFVAWLSQRGDYNIPADLVGLALLTSDLPAIYERQATEKKAAGRYTLEEAAGMLEQQTGERASAILGRLMKDAGDGALPRHEPGRQAKYEPNTVSEFSEEFYWDDLNAWLVKHEPRITWRFPKPAAQNDANAADAKADSGGKTWIDEARRIALEYIVRHKKLVLFPSQTDVCTHVAKTMRDKKIYGPHGKPLEPSYIQRDAIQGEWWQANKP